MGNQLFLQSEEGKKKQAKMVDYAVKSISSLGYTVVSDDTSVWFYFKGSKVTHFAYTGWHTGKTIVDGRGIKKLLDQIKSKP